MNTVHKDAREGIYNLPIWANGADIAQGAFVKRGATPGTNNGALMQAAGGDNANVDIIGRLMDMLDYSVTGETLIAGTSFVTKRIKLAHDFRVHRIEYSLASADLVTCTQAVSTTTITLTSLEDDIDASFLYVAAGTGIGQTNYLTASAAGSATLKAAFGTSLDTSSKLVKVLPRFHPKCILTTDGTKLSSQAAVGQTSVTVLDTYIEQNGMLQQMNPTRHAALTGRNSLRSFRLWADIAFRDTLPYSID